MIPLSGKKLEQDLYRRSLRVCALYQKRFECQDQVVQSEEIVFVQIDAVAIPDVREVDHAHIDARLVQPRAVVFRVRTSLIQKL